MFEIISTKLDVPHSAVTRSVGSQQPTTGYYHLLDEYAASCMPLGKRRPSDDDLKQYVPSCAWVTTAYQSDQDWDLAIEQTARWAAEQCAVRDLSIGAVIFCHTSVPQDLSASIPARFQHLLGAKKCVPIALSQSDSAAAVIALKMACAYIAGEWKAKNVLIVGAERWTRPFFRCFGDVLCYGDGIAAAIVSSNSEPRGQFSLKAAALAVAPGCWDPFSSTPSFTDDEFVPAIAEALSRALHESGFGESSSFAIVGPAWSPSIVRKVQEMAGLPPPLPTSPRGFLGAADMLATLDEIRDRVDVGDDIYAWTATLSGQVGVCALTRSRSTFL
jgi:hypothetical protein